MSIQSVQHHPFQVLQSHTSRQGLQDHIGES